MNLNAAISLSLFIILLSSTISLANADVEEMTVFVKPIKDEFFVDELVHIVGTIKDKETNPIQGVNVQVSFADETIQTATDDFGLFNLKATKTIMSGQYAASVIASKPDYNQTSTTVTFSVIENFQTTDILNQVESTVQGITIIIGDGITKNPLSQLILRQMEAEKKQYESEEQKKKEISEKNNFLEEKRQEAQASLEDDLISFEKENEFYHPRASFGRFIADYESVIQSVFWGQFALTEQKTKEAHEAKLNALEEGKTPQEAMKIFQRKAAITHREMIQHNTNLNIQYGLANQTTQDQFDADGKLRDP